MQLKTFILTLIIIAILPLSLMAQSNITEPGATNPNQLYTTTYDNPAGPHRATYYDFDGPDPENPGYGDNNPTPYDEPIGAPWILLGFAAAYGAFRLKRS